MNLIRLSLDRPVAVIAAVIMVVMFGVVALQTIPIQLTPDVRRPVLTVRTDWNGGAPAEIEREIVDQQEEVIKGLEGLVKMTSRSEDRRGEITLEFKVGQNMDRALLLLSNRLDRVTDKPAEADEPRIGTSGSEDSPIAWFVLTRADGNTRAIHTYGDFVENVIRDRMERVKGVSRINVFGGSERELRVIVDPARMARYGLTVSNVVNALRRANASVSAGDVEEGKRRYVVRTQGDLKTPEAVRQVVLRSLEDTQTGRVARVTLGQIAKVAFGYKKPTARIRFLGEPAMAFNAVRDTGANVIATMAGIRAAVADLNRSALPATGLKLQQVYDETVYINSAIDLVQQNIVIGGVLAALILMLFLRSWRATLVISLAIPVSVVGSFVAMAALGRSINVISLAGLAFAVGMVVDAAIVVLENIFRLRQEGLSARDAAYEGTRQVWGAVLVSALTTVMVFIPIMVMELEVGQLFRDIAVAISVSVMLSLLVAATLIPALANWLFGGRAGAASSASAVQPALHLPVIDGLARAFVRLTLAFAELVGRRRGLAVAVVAVICGAASLATWQLLPKLEYLPEGNRNLVFGVILPPPGYNLATMTDIAKGLENTVRPYWATVTGPTSPPCTPSRLDRAFAALAKVDPAGAWAALRGPPATCPPPKMARFFFVATRGRTFVGAAAVDGSRAGELIPVLRKPVFKEPGTFGFIAQPSIFGRHIGGGRVISLDISGPGIQNNLAVALRAVRLIGMVMPLDQGNQLRPIPGLELGAPEVRVVPDRMRLADNGVTARELADTVDAFNDGLRVAEITVDGRRIDLTLMGTVRNVDRTQGIATLPVVTSSGRIVPAGALAKIAVTAGPTEIRHLERARTVTLEIRPAPDLPLEVALDRLKSGVIGALEKAGLPAGVKLGLSGTADKLTETWDSMMVDLILAIAIVYLVMAVLFESFVYPLIILLSVPLATAGGVLGLAVLNLYTRQSLDMLTLLGFIILIGIVVNNAILLVHQTLANLRERGMTAAAAIRDSTRTRIRPIFMSTLTSVFGMLPLVLFPGAGSELYRGLGSVVIGGLALSAVLTLTIIPPLLSLMIPMVERGKGAGATRPVPAPAGE